MPPHPSPLADSVASLRAATLATPAHAWLPAAIHALILACLARILGRLEEMIRLWQAGLLPPPVPRPRTAPATSRPRAARPNPDSVPHPRPAMQARNHKEAERQRDDSKVSPLMLLSVSLPLCGFPFFPSLPRRAAITPAAGHLLGIAHPPIAPRCDFPKIAVPTERPKHALNILRSEH